MLLVRAAVLPLDAQSIRWPAENDQADCRRWLEEVWAVPPFSEAVRSATPRLAQAVDGVLRGEEVSAKQLRKMVHATARYFLRAAGRPTPFGLFAGVATAVCGPCEGIIGAVHKPLARPDTLWLDHVRRGLVSRPDVVPHLRFCVSDLAVRRGDVLDMPLSGGRLASTRVLRPMAALLDLATSPVIGSEILDRLSALGGTPAQAAKLLTDALEVGALTSDLSAPMTDTDPLGHMLHVLTPASADLKPDTVALLDELSLVQRLFVLHNSAQSPVAARKLREMAAAKMTGICDEGRTRLSLDLRLNATVRVPQVVLEEAERAGEALLRLTRNLREQPMWSSYHEVFWERYGAGSLVPVRDAVDLAAGAGLPADFPMSPLAEPPVRALPRDEQLLRRAWQAVMHGAEEVLLTDADIDELCTADLDELPIVPHMEMGMRVLAESPAAVDQGDFTLAVRPAWSTGTLSGRFAVTLDGDSIGAAYGKLPTLVDGALAAQLSFTPPHPHAENIGRIPAFLPYVIPVGEHREPADNVIPLDDLAVMSTGTRMLLVSMSRRRVVEPVVLHPLALEKQAPPVARFLALVARSFAGAWTRFDWGPLTVGMPYLPRVRYGRSILSPARWHLGVNDLPSAGFGPAWHETLSEWARTWKCPSRVELYSDDRYLRLDLTEPVHAHLLHAHLRRQGSAELVETPPDQELGWIGHAHELTLPMTSTRSPLPHPDVEAAPVVRNQMLAPPAAAEQRWAQAKIFTHPSVMDQILTRRLPELLDSLGGPASWFIRYRTSQEDDHLRLRIALPEPDAHAAIVEALADWAGGLQRSALASRLVLDGYRPEFGRYGTGDALGTAEEVFVADSEVTRYLLADLPKVDRRVLVALGMIDVARGLLGDMEGARWLATSAADAAGRQEVTRTVLDEVRVHGLGPRSGWPDRINAALQRRRAALAAYRAQLDGRPVGPVLESLLHMHHNRLMGPDREAEAACRHAARQACRSVVARGAADE
ncbi:lantibiotic dehydratase [Actinacidiphila sp. ITFR-21]|uniref:lantibiotic dehydratase n=1 Tax=Actinacidiphila sp. ITFR-21 TaxID=3075199 RepID=UPI00288C5932|nr:lantibiotic dehydratase [Streptomyces sp. ITFR-21]WNI17645.1 lantibiotic dehydratase [Streptomyces sp. ITFR-21]WNI17785.1 lantibiotic dehydratase [Streptomyces sp. ITFR-21]